MYHASSLHPAQPTSGTPEPTYCTPPALYIKFISSSMRRGPLELILLMGRVEELSTALRTKPRYVVLVLHSIFVSSEQM